MDSLRVSGVKEYGEVDWSALAGRMHPLDWILEHGFPVYCRVERNLNFAVTWGYRPLAAGHKPPLGVLSPPPTDFLFEKRDERLTLLRLDDASVEDLRATGKARLREFRLGGLALRQAAARDGSRPIGSELEQVDFAKCILVDRMQWEALVALRTPESLWWRFSHMPLTREVYLDDLCFEDEDVTGEVASPDVVDWLDYPLAHLRGDPCPHLLWAYRGAMAFRERRDAPRSEITEWLRHQPPKELFNNRLIRTARNLVPYDYRENKNLDRRAFAKLPLATEIDSLPAVGFALKCALAAWYWWQELDTAREGVKLETLARMLLDLGFLELAIVDLVKMISDHSLSTREVTGLVRRAMQKTHMDSAKDSNNSHLYPSPADGFRRTSPQDSNEAADNGKAELEDARASGPGLYKPLGYSLK